jgi:hypothetical protein
MYLHAACWEETTEKQQSGCRTTWQSKERYRKTELRGTVRKDVIYIQVATGKVQITFLMTVINHNDYVRSLGDKNGMLRHIVRQIMTNVSYQLFAFIIRVQHSRIQPSLREF